MKAALHRARGRLQELAETPAEPPVLTPAERDRLQAYADRFDARDFDSLRDLLAEDVHLEVVNRIRLAGRKQVSKYFSRYDEMCDWWFSVGLADARLALIVHDPADAERTITHIVLLKWVNGQIAAMRDFKYAPYVLNGMTVSSI